MKAILAVLFAVLTTAAFAAPAAYDRPGGYHAQVKAGSLVTPVNSCPIPVEDRISPEVCAKPAPK